MALGEQESFPFLRRRRGANHVDNRESVCLAILRLRVSAIIQAPISSKLPSRRAKNEFYRYYAGYPLSFAEWALKELGLPKEALVLDPWNGSGTTAAACARLGMSCQGYDINPVMVHLGRARVASAADFEEAEELISAVEEIIGKQNKISISEFGAAFRELPVGNESSHSVAIASLFPYARKLLASSKTKNPSWFRKGSIINDVQINKCILLSEWRILLKSIYMWRNITNDTDGISIIIERGDSRKSLGRRDTADGVLTSPPYLTRLDYVQATLPEFLLLKELDVMPNMERLRRSMLGSPLTSERPTSSLERLPPDVRNLLNQISTHSSKASQSYYHRFFSTYFVDLQASMRNISKAMKDGASGCIVVQSSSYKEIEIDLSSIVVSMASQFRLKHTNTVKFGSRRSMSLVNSRAHEEARKPKSEAAIFFRKA